MDNVEKNMIKLIEPVSHTEELKKECQRLWEDNFDDTEEYISFYFSDRWNESTVFICDRRSMIHLNPYDMYLCGKETKIYYIVGVCTIKQYRHRGYMDALLKKSLRYLYEKSAPFVYLMPADEKIYTPYDFTGVYKIRPLKIIKNKTKSVSESKLTVTGYDRLTEEQKKELCIYSDKLLAENFNCYVKRDIFYFEQKDSEMKACGGELLVFFDKDKIKGYAMYINEDIPEIVEFVSKDKCVEEHIKSLFEYAYVYSDAYGKDNGQTSYTQNKDEEMEFRFDESYFTDSDDIDKIKGRDVWKIYDKEKSDLLMARIVDVKSFVEMLRIENDEDIFVEIEDKLIKENNGRWHIHIGKESCIRGYHQKTDEGSYIEKNKDKYKKMTISQFGELMLLKLRFYLNEMV